MATRYVASDLFVNTYKAQVFAHGSNCIGSMGAGITFGFSDCYPDMYQEYQRRCKATPRLFNPGDCLLWKAEDKPWVFNLATQEHPLAARAGAHP